MMNEEPENDAASDINAARAPDVIEIMPPRPIDASNTALQNEHERRARSLRLMLTFLLMLLLMDDETSQKHRESNMLLLKKWKRRKRKVLAPDVFQKRQEQDKRLALWGHDDFRYQQLTRKNHRDVQKEVEAFVMQSVDIVKDEFAAGDSSSSLERITVNEHKDPDEDQRVFHYPWNTTGFYRGEWKRMNHTPDLAYDAWPSCPNETLWPDSRRASSVLMSRLPPPAYAAVRIIPGNISIYMRDDHNMTSMRYEDMTVDSGGHVFDPVDSQTTSSRLTLQRQDGRVAFQFYSRPIPTMKEMSLVDGFIKLYDSQLSGYSTSRDVLARVRGVLFHSTGRLSLVSAPVTRSALVIRPGQPGQRRLSEAEEALRDAAWGQRRRLEKSNATDMNATQLYPWSDSIIPFPFVRDDLNESIRKERTQGSRRMPARERPLEANALMCDFEVDLLVEEVEWTVGAWRQLVKNRALQAQRLDPFRNPPNSTQEDDIVEMKRNLRRRTKSKPLEDQAVALQMSGSIISHRCQFSATLNATAIRTDWDKTTSKAISYSFYMLLVCLVQIALLLRQLLHAQGQSAAMRVSLMCIAWQTLLDALSCLMHIYFSLAMQPVFTAFAAVAFFKLLVFCVIEMKTMSLILQAHNSSNGGDMNDLRRKIAKLHARFYTIVLASFLAVFYMGENLRTPYGLLLYSFWVPQIITNIITEAKMPLHKHYIWGMSITRLFAPLYFFGTSGSFLKDVYIDLQPDPLLCELLVLWVGIQLSVLLAQGKYGARFMIPARFLPPKFDYSRPLPPSMLPPGVVQDSDDSSHESDEEMHTLVSPGHRHETISTTRNRRRGFGRLQPTRGEGMTADPPEAPLPSSHALVCSICYEPIDIRSRNQYALAPCNHLFHRECLLQWMDIKMECPICRITLPTV